MKMKKMATVYLLLLAAALPASAQFEVSPDHYLDEQEPVRASIPAGDRLRQEIAEQQAAIRASKATLAERRENLDLLLQEAMTAGMQADGGAGQVEAYLAAEHNFQVISTTLAARIKSDETRLASLQNELAALRAPQKPGPATVASRTRHGRTKGEVLLASR